MNFPFGNVAGERRVSVMINVADEGGRVPAVSRVP
jgi:hypothetical protein